MSVKTAKARLDRLRTALLFDHKTSALTPCGTGKIRFNLGSVRLLLLLAAVQGQAATDLPPSAKIELGSKEEVCSNFVDPAARKEQTIDGVKIQESLLCDPDAPADIAAFVKGTNNVSMETLMATQLASDAITLSDDMDGDGDPDKVVIKLEVVEINGHSPDVKEPITTFDIAPGLQPTFWVYAPKNRDMSTRSLYEPIANPLLRAPSPVIRVEQDDVVWIVLENTHYLPHSIHLHGVSTIPIMNHGGSGNDGVGQTSNMDTMPGETKTYVIKPRQPGHHVLSLPRTTAHPYPDGLARDFYRRGKPPEQLGADF